MESETGMGWSSSRKRKAPSSVCGSGPPLSSNLAGLTLARQNVLKTSRTERCCPFDSDTSRQFVENVCSSAKHVCLLNRWTSRSQGFDSLILRCRTELGTICTRRACPRPSARWAGQSSKLSSRLSSLTPFLWCTVSCSFRGRPRCCSMTTLCCLISLSPMTATT